MAQRKTPGTSKITRDNTVPKRTQRGSSPEIEVAGGEAAPDTERQVTTEEIAQRAYEKYLARGGANGDEVSDWLAAEAELRASR